MALIQKYGITVLPSRVRLPGSTVEIKEGRVIVTGDVPYLHEMPPKEREACLRSMKKRAEENLSLEYSRQLAENPEKFWREHQHLFENEKNAAAV